MNVLLTGATGFIGSRLAQALHEKPDAKLTAIVRRRADVDAFRVVDIASLDESANLADTLAGQHVVIHTAARAHSVGDRGNDNQVEYDRINVGGTINLAQQAIEADVKRFVYISSIKVNGEETGANVKFSANDDPCPEDAYGRSKWHAEQELLKLAATSDMEVVIIRPPLVYGPGVKGNLQMLVQAVHKGVPLPFGNVKNLRSLISLENLVSVIIASMDWRRTPQAKNQVLLVSDGEDVSLTELLRKIALAYGVQARLLPVPVWLMTLVMRLTGRSGMARRLFCNLRVDVSSAQNLLGWEPVTSMDDELLRMAQRDRMAGQL